MTDQKGISAFRIEWSCATDLLFNTFSQVLNSNQNHSVTILLCRCCIICSIQLCSVVIMWFDLKASTIQLQTHVQAKYPEPTELGWEFVKSMNEEAFYVYPEADMLLARKLVSKPFSSFSEWGKGWADPEIRRQRLERMGVNRKSGMLSSSKRKRKRKGGKVPHDLSTSRGRLAAKLSKYKWYLSAIKAYNFLVGTCKWTFSTLVVN